MLQRKITVMLAAASFWTTGALADCTVDKIKTCTFNDPSMAEQVLLKAVAKESTPRLLGQLADFYRTAPTVFQDDAKYRWYLRRAANAGDPPSMIAYADLMIRGDNVLRDADGGVKLLKQAAVVGPPGPALIALGKYYLSINDRQHAIEALLDAADHDDPDALPLLSSLDPAKVAALSPSAAGKPGAAPAQSAPTTTASIPPPALSVPTTAQPMPPPVQSAPAPKLSDGGCVEPASLPPVAARASPTIVPATSLYDPPSTYAGQQLALRQIFSLAYAAGFRSEDGVLAMAGLAIAESDLWTQARNWKPDQGYRDASEAIGVKGPAEAWSPDGRQLHSDRGIWQISSLWWPEPDNVVDDPAKAAVIAYALSRGGCDFSAWDSFKSGMAQKHYDRAVDQWPALRPLVKSFLATITARGDATGSTTAKR